MKSRRTAAGQASQSTSYALPPGYDPWRIDDSKQHSTSRLPDPRWVSSIDRCNDAAKSTLSVDPSRTRKDWFGYEEALTRDKNNAPDYTRTLLVLVRDFDFYGGREQPDKLRRQQMQVKVGDLTSAAFPQHFLVTLWQSDETTVMYTHTCTPFSFRTLVQQQKGTVRLSDERDFQRFPNTLKRLVHAVYTQASSYRAELLLYRKSQNADLCFYETSSQYRDTLLLTLRMARTASKHVCATLNSSMRALTTELSLCRSRLVRLLDIVQKHAPTLLLKLPTWPSQRSGAVVTDRQHSAKLQAAQYIEQQKHRTGTSAAAELCEVVIHQETLHLDDKWTVAVVAPQFPNQDAPAQQPPYYRLVLWQQCGSPAYYATPKITRKRFARLLDSTSEVAFWPDEHGGGFLGFIVVYCLRQSRISPTKRFSAHLTIDKQEGCTLLFQHQLALGPQTIVAFDLARSNDSKWVATLARQDVSRLRREIDDVTQHTALVMAAIRRHKPALVMHFPRVPSCSTPAVSLFEPHPAAHRFNAADQQAAVGAEEVQGWIAQRAHADYWQRRHEREEPARQLWPPLLVN